MVTVVGSKQGNFLPQMWDALIILDSETREFPLF